MPKLDIKLFKNERFKMNAFIDGKKKLICLKVMMLQRILNIKDQTMRF